MLKADISGDLFGIKVLACPCIPPDTFLMWRTIEIRTYKLVAGKYTEVLETRCPVCNSVLDWRHL